jgi:hypothetical protein
MPTPPPQTTVNRYAAPDVGVATNAVDLDLRISHPDNSYNYQQLGAAGSGAANAVSGGIFNNVSGLDYLAQTDTTLAPYTFAGFAVENMSDVSVLDYGYGGGPFTADFEVGVPAAQDGCIAPNGTVSFSLLRVPVATPLIYTPGSDSLYGSGKMTFKEGVFSYSDIQEFSAGGTNAATYATPFANSSCIESFDGYAIQSEATHPTSSEADNMVVYMGPTGTFAGNAYTSFLQTDGTYSIPVRTGFLGVVHSAQPIDLSSVTQGNYKGFNLQPQSGSPGNPAFFGKTSMWVTSPVFEQGGGELVGGVESPFAVLFSNPPPQVTGNTRISFGAADSVESGLFPKAAITEPDPASMCPVAQQSTGSDGQVYCTFPVVALIEKSYGKFVIFIAGPEPTTGQSLFYALVQE